MRVLLIHYYNSIANPAYTQISLALRSIQCDVAVAYRDTDNNLAFDATPPLPTIKAPLQQEKSGIVPKLAYNISFLFFIFRIRRFIRQHKPNIVQINRAKIPWFWVIPLLMPRKIKFILDCRQVSVTSRSPNAAKALRQNVRKTLHRFFIQHIFDRATYLHERGAVKELGNSWGKYGTVVPLGVGTRFLTKLPSEKNVLRPLSFLYIGSITRIRKLDLLIEAAVLQKKISGANFRLVFAGPDNTGGYYQALGKKLGVDDVVSFIPPTPYEQMPEVIYAHDVALAYVPDEPQDWVYQPTLKILEYQALGVPVLATAVPPNVDIIEASANGVVVNNTAEEWQKGMNRYITDRAFLETTRKNARENRKAHSWDEVASLYCDLYRSL